MFPLVLICTSKFNVIFLSHKMSGQIFKFNMFHMTTLWVQCKKIGKFEWDYMKNYSPFTMRYDFFSNRHKSIKFFSLSIQYRQCNMKKHALIWNSMRVIKISPTARFQETNQWDNRPSYIDDTNTIDEVLQTLIMHITIADTHTILHTS